MRFKKSPQLPGAGRTRAWHYHGSHTPTSSGAILLSKMACQPKHFGRQCMHLLMVLIGLIQYSTCVRVTVSDIDLNQSIIVGSFRNTNH